MATDSRALSCFVISPIGDPEETPERHAEGAAVLEHIIQPAVARFNAERPEGMAPIVAVRGDEIFTPGGIVQQVVESISHDDLLIAVMFEDNVNVFFELGIAETLGRPVILLHKSGYVAPFDVRGERCVVYPKGRLEPGPATDKAVRALTLNFLQLLANNNRYKSPFDLKLMAPPARVTPFDRFLDLSHAEWSRMLLAAEHEVWLAGTTLWPSMLDPSFRGFCKPRLVGRSASFEAGSDPCNIMKLLETLYRSGREVNVLTMDENSDLLPAMLHVSSDDPDALAAKPMDVREQIRASHRVLTGKLEALASDCAANPDSPHEGVFRVAKISRRTLSARVSMTDRRGYVTPIFYSLGVNSGPCFEVAPKSGLELKKGQRNDSYEQICMYKQVRDDLVLHIAESETIALVRGRLVYGGDAGRLAG